MSAFKYQWNQTIDVGTAGLLSKQWTSIRHILSLLVTAKACVHVTAYVAVRRSLSTTYTAVVLGLLLRQYVSYQFGVWAGRYDATKDYRFTFGLGSRYMSVITRQFWFWNVSADSTQFGVMSDLIRSWIGLESVSGRPTYARYITDLRPTYYLPSVTELRPIRPRTLPDKTDT